MIKLTEMSVLRFCSAAATAASTQVCIVGAGPAGFYAAQHLTKKLNFVNVDIIEKLPVPFGLIRYGVAPDHPDVKNVINTFTKVAHQPNVNFYGNITLGRDISLAQLRQHYHVVLLTYGAEEDKLLGIENENADNVIAARQFVGWYNGLPDNTHLKVDLSGHTATILGQGNVAMDVARMLLTPIDILSKTDITAHSLQVLADSRIKEVYLIGRRGPIQASFTIKELREQIKMPGCATQWRREDFEGVEEALPSIQRPKKRLTELMLKSVSESQNQTFSDNLKVFKPVFHRSPIKFIMNNSKLVKLELMCNKLVGEDIVNKTSIATGEVEVLECDVAFRSIGYKSIKADEGIHFDCKKGLAVNHMGRTILPNGSKGDVDWGLYVGGWLATGPIGVILNTMSNAFQVAGAIVEDLHEHSDKLNASESRGGFSEIGKILNNKDIQVVDWLGWEKIDKYEIEYGKKLGKPREKVCSVKKMLEIAI